MEKTRRVRERRLGRDFRWLLASAWSSNLADGIMLAAGPLLIASLTTDARLVALAATLQWVAKLLFGLPSGAITDRVDRVRLISIVNVARALLLAALTAALAVDRVSIAGVLLVFFLFGIAEVFADNASGALVPSLVHRDDLAAANSRLVGSVIVGNQLAGPPIGAALFVVGSATAFGAQVALIGVAVAFVLRVRHQRAVDPAEPGELAQQTASSVAADIRVGVVWVARHPAVRTLVLTIMLFNVPFGAAWSVLVLYANDHVGLGAVGFGLLTTLSAIGGLIGTAAYGMITRRVSLGALMRVGLLVETIVYLSLALVSRPSIVMGIFLVFGAHAFIWHTTSITVRQRAVPQQLQGRVNSVNSMGVFAGMVVGSALGGPIAERWGIVAPYWCAFGAAVVFVLLLWRPLAHVSVADDHPVSQ